MIRARLSYAQWWLRSVPDKIARAVVWRLPRRLVYWSAIRVAASATTGRYSDQIVPDLTVVDALDRWGV